MNTLNTDQWSDIGGSHQSLNDKIYQALREAIFRGDYKPGDKLTETGLAKLFNVSRIPIREVLRKLQSEGIVEIPPRKSARLPVFSSEEIDEVVEIRAEIEGLTAQFATNNLTEETSTLFRNLLEEGNKVAQLKDATQMKKLNNEFHTLLSKSGKNRFLEDYLRTLRDRTIWLFEQGASERIYDSWKEHATVLEAVISLDKNLAGMLAAHHVRKIGRGIIKILKESKGNLD